MWWLFAQKYVCSFQESQQGCTYVSAEKNSHLPCKTHNSYTFTGETIHHSLSIKMFCAKWWETVWQMAGDLKLLCWKLMVIPRRLQCASHADARHKHLTRLTNTKRTWCVSQQSECRLWVTPHARCVPQWSQVCRSEQPFSGLIMCKKDVVGQV